MLNEKDTMEVKKAITKCSIEKLLLLREKHGTIPYNAEYIYLALKVSRPALLEWVTENQWDFDNDDRMLKLAISNEDHCAYQWLQDNTKTPIRCLDSVVAEAIRYGNMGALKWLARNTKFNPGVQSIRAAVTHRWCAIHMLNFLLNNAHTFYFHAADIRDAARNENKSVINWFAQQIADKRIHIKKGVEELLCMKENCECHQNEELAYKCCSSLSREACVDH